MLLHLPERVEYLDHVMTPQGISPNNNQISAISDFSVPSTVKEVCQFVGLASYYRRFIHGFAKVAQPLYSLTQKDVTFQWSSECELAFQQLKTALVNSPVLAYPNFSKAFTLETDAT